MLRSLSGPARVCALAATLLLSASGSSRANEAIDVAPIWAGHPVGFCLLTHRDQQFVAFYDANRQMTVARRQLDSKEWQFVRLDQKLGWDSHNYVTMAVDDDGRLHLSGNMHGHPLVYYRTKQPLDITSFERVPQMIGVNEKHCTYPIFMDGPDGRLVFMYRDGSSGNGNQILNVYELTAQTWKRLLDAPLFDGEGQRNAYLYGPIRDREGAYHLAYVWRESGDCATNHDLSYARSRDLVDWETSAGRPLKLPITLATSEIVDPVPVGGGLMNSNVRLGFDSQNRPIISYHKYDAQGFIQIWNARLEAGSWKRSQASNWSTRYEYRGGGSLGGPVRVGAIEVTSGGLKQGYRDASRRTGAWLLDETTLKPIRELKPQGLSGQTRPYEPASSAVAASDVAAALRGGRTSAQSTPVWMELRTAGDLGRSNEPNVRYELRWETWPANRDRPRKEPPPAPTMLRVYRIAPRITPP